MNGWFIKIILQGMVIVFGVDNQGTGTMMQDNVAFHGRQEINQAGFAFVNIPLYFVRIG